MTVCVGFGLGKKDRLGVCWLGGGGVWGHMMDDWVCVCGGGGGMGI